MAGYSRELVEYKQTAMARILESQTIVDALHARDAEGNPLPIEKLPYTHIFPYGYLPFTVETAGCYITLEVSMPAVSTANYFFKDVLLTITIICHQKLMRMEEEQTGATRVDYIAIELDKIFNNQKGMGFGEMSLVSNVEETLDMYHRCRIMRFQTLDTNKSFC